jgi:hypothetical protein
MKRHPARTCDLAIAQKISPELMLTTMHKMSGLLPNRQSVKRQWLERM